MSADEKLTGDTDNPIPGEDEIFPGEEDVEEESLDDEEIQEGSIEDEEFEAPATEEEGEDMDKNESSAGGM